MEIIEDELKERIKKYKIKKWCLLDKTLEFSLKLSLLMEVLETMEWEESEEWFT